MILFARARARARERLLLVEQECLPLEARDYPLYYLRFEQKVQKCAGMCITAARRKDSKKGTSGGTLLRNIAHHRAIRGDSPLSHPIACYSHPGRRSNSAHPCLPTITGITTLGAQSAPTHGFLPF